MSFAFIHYISKAISTKTEKLKVVGFFIELFSYFIDKAIHKLLIPLSDKELNKVVWWHVHLLYIPHSYFDIFRNCFYVTSKKKKD